MSSLSASAATHGATTPEAGAPAIPVVVPHARAVLLLVSTAVIALAVYYFIGVDQGAVSVFGNDMHVHEFVHDARHFLGFPCH
ncbi:CbtB domain-containing protein [Actinacidiphila rubida]|uniref:Probable cobalt transporter subunit (CbtB) n=1 Tax=Actinacidiphila rubida TaxID=310780 RepID=A0A1H8TCL2_9ACTN|nr:CbtB-domain containing protein [Actinacidiphila rubida]SEO88642.1 Probable cobalt transporter subunit (CbtB) [Actinacidiphila rubida]